MNSMAAGSACMAMECEPSRRLALTHRATRLAAPVSTTSDKFAERTAEPVVAEISGTELHSGKPNWK